jgi:hypothetical protein
MQHVFVSLLPIHLEVVQHERRVSHIKFSFPFLSRFFFIFIGHEVLMQFFPFILCEPANGQQLWFYCNGEGRGRGEHSVDGVCL